MTLLDELRAVVGALDQAGVESALVGGLAVAVWGAPRRVISREALIQMKAAAGRPQDALDIQNLEEVER